MYTLDTNVIIYYLDEDKNALSFLRNIFNKSELTYISAMSEIELFAFPLLSDEEIVEIERILQTISTIPVDSRVARLAANLRRVYGLRVPDSAIAATAIFTGSILVTRNVRDFKRIPELKLQGI